jgi:DNA-binding NtrC family response regulator
VAGTRVNVMIYGKRGTEKKLLAKTIHNRSTRADKPFFDINCTGLTEQLLELELFGHERGIFADARSLKSGLLELADGGTAFLEEIGDMPLTLQNKFARSLEIRTFRRVGGTQDISIGARIIAATDRDLKKAAEDGTFLEDLYYRLNVVTITLPDLKDRPEDIPLLARDFVQKFAQELKPTIRDISNEAIELLRKYPWPGNLRELENVLERVVVLAHGPVIQPDDLLPHLAGGLSPVEEALAKEASVEELEQEYIKAVLRRTGGHQIRAAAILGIDRRTLYRKIRRYNLKVTGE